MASVSMVGITQVGQISVITHDLPRAVAFYRDVLELPFLFRTGDLAFFDCGGVRLMLSPPHAPELDHPASLIYFAVDDIDTAYLTLRQRGVHFLDAPHLVARMPGRELWMAFFNDIDGNTLALMSERTVR